jgi:hypothetical protein
MSNRIEREMSFTDYLAHEAFGSSDIRAAKLGPLAIVPWQRANRNHDTEATQIGRGAHCAILTPDLFARDFAVKPEGMEFRSKENKELRDRWLAEGKTILSQEQWQQIRDVHAALCGKLPVFDALHAAVAREASVFWTDPDSGLQCKARPDWFTEDAVYDLKVSIAAERDLDGLVWKVHSMGWLNQLASNRAALNANGCKIKKGRLVVIAPNPPQELRVHMLEVRESDLDFLELDNVNVRRQMAVCVKTGVWPGTPDTWQQIELPASAAFTEADLEGAEEIPI